MRYGMRKICAVLLLLGVCLLTSSQAQQVQDDGQKYALLIGVSNQPNFPADKLLHYADRDATQFSNFLQSPEGGAFPARNIKLLVNQRATREDIEEAIEWLRLRTHRNDTVYVYFSGHGLEDDAGIVYLMTWGSKYISPSVGAIRANYFLNDLTEKLNVQHLLVFFDACHAAAAATKNGSTMKGGETVNVQLKQQWETLLKNREASNMAFFSAGSNQTAMEDAQKQSGLFTWYLLAGLRGAADANKDKVVTAGEVHRYLVDEVSEFSKQQQTPMVSQQFNATYPLAVLAGNDLYAQALAVYDRRDYPAALKLLNEVLVQNSAHNEAYLKRGYAKLTLGDSQGALADLNQGLKLDPKHANAYNTRGSIKLTLGDKEGALADYTQAIQLDPTEGFFYSNRGVAKFQLGDKQGAIADYTQAIKIDPKDAIGYQSRGNVKLHLGDKRGALADYNQAIQLDLKFAAAYDGRGNVKFNLGDKQGAIADYTQAIQLDPEYKFAYNNRGNTKDDLGDKQGAIADYNQALLLDPKFVDAYNNRGVAKFQLGDKQGAIADYNQALLLDLGFAAAYHNRGVAKSKLKDKQGAIADWQQAARLGNTASQKQLTDNGYTW
jgi:tetratricopeptide (TPR) repeat protein